MNSQATILRAAFVAPMDQPMIHDGAVMIASGAIAAVGAAQQIRDSHPEATIEDLGSAILLPGLINAHTHLEFSLAGSGGATAGMPFTEWLANVRARGNIQSGNPQQIIESAVEAGLAQSLRFGVTCLGDITQAAPVVRAAIGKIKHRPRIVSYGEVLGLARRRHRVDELIAQALAPTVVSDATTLRIGLSPHAPYTVDRPGYEQCLRIARQRKLPLATHLAESPDERAFLESQSGPFRELWDRLGWWSDPVETFNGSPIEFADEIGLLDYPTLLAHVNYCDDRELALLAAGRASVVYCPRTHRYFGHPPHRWRQMLAAGVNVAVGTDSCASSPDLNLVDELRLLHEMAPEMSCESIWQMGTIRAARALQMQDRVGSITPGKRADLLLFETDSDDPLRDLLERPSLPARVWIS